MNNNLEHARALLESEGYTCVLCCGSTVITSHDRGARPLLNLLDSGSDFRGFCAADKVVGRAAAFLYVLLGVKAVHASIISKPAADTLKRFGIDASYDRCVEGIINRAGTGPCPMEASVSGIESPDEALDAIKAKLLELSKQ